MKNIVRLLAGSLACAGFVFTSAAHAADPAYPAKPVRLIVGMAPGGSNDTIARMIAADLTKSWPQPQVVDNKPGANSTIATAELKRSPADGYTLMLVISSHVTNTMLYPALPYTLADFAPVSLIGDTPFALVANPKFAPNNVRELIALAKAKPNSIDFGTPGAGSTQHIALELLDQMAGIKMNHIPYKGGAPAQTDVIAGQIPLIYATPTQSLPFVKQKQLKALGITSQSRLEIMKDVPTLNESGVPGYEASVWFAIIAPGGTPAPMVDYLNKEITRVISTPAFRTRLAEMGVNPLAGSPTQLQQLIDAENKKWTAVVRDAKIKID